MARSGELLPRVLWRVAPRLALGMARRQVRTPVVETSPERDTEARLQAQTIDLAASGQFDRVLETLRGQLSSRATTVTGLRHSEVTLPALYAGLYQHDNDPEAADAAVEPFRKWYAERGADPDVAALVGRAIQILAGFRRGPQPEEETSDEQWRGMVGCLVEAGDILDGARPGGEKRELWHRARFRGAILECENPADAQERFERFLAFDPDNIETYLERTYQLLPRWFGSYDDIEQFARQSVDRTSGAWGKSLYMMIYGQVGETEPLPRTFMDWDLILAAFDDALGRFPPVQTINRFLPLAARFGQREIVRQLFDELPELRLDCWQNEDEPFEVHAWAFGRGPWPYRN